MKIELDNGSVLVPAPGMEGKIIAFIIGRSVDQETTSPADPPAEDDSEGKEKEEPAPSRKAKIINDPPAAPPRAKAKSKNAYTDEDIEKIIKMAKEGIDAADIAKELSGHRNKVAVYAKIQELKRRGLINLPPKAKPRRGSYENEEVPQDDDNSDSDDDDDDELDKIPVEDAAGIGTLGKGFRPF